MTQNTISRGELLNTSRCLSGGWAFDPSSGSGLSCGCFGISSGLDLSAGPVSSARTLRLMERMLSRGGVLLGDGRRYAAAAALVTVVGLAAVPNAYGLDVSSGATSSGVVVSSGSNNPMNVLAGGTANSTTINSGGSQYIFSGGSAINTTVNSGGYQRISSGGIASGTTINSGGGQYISSGGTASATTLSGGGQFISGGGIANSTTINRGGFQGVYSSGGTANNATINSGGTQCIFDDGVASGTVINSRGFQEIYNGGVATSTTINGDGYQEIYSGGVADTTTISAGGSQHVSSGGTATTVNNSGRQFVFGSASGTIIYNGGTQTIAGGGVATSTTISSGGWQQVRGSANITTVHSGGTQYIDSHAKATDVAQSAGGNVIADVGSGYTNVITGSNASGSFSLSGGTATNFIIYAGGYQNIVDGGVASSTTISSGGRQEISADGTATSTTISEGYQTVSSGGTASSTTISGGSQLVYGGVASSTTISGGYQYISAGGSAIGTTVDMYGSQYVLDGGTAISATITHASARQEVSSGGVASNTDAQSGVQYVRAGGIAYDTTVSDGGMYMDGGSISGSASFENANSMWGSAAVLLDGAQIIFKSGGNASVSTSLSGSGGIVLSGGTLNLTGNNTHSGNNVVSGGSLFTSIAGALGSGHYEVASGATLSFYADQTIASLKGSGNVAFGHPTLPTISTTLTLNQNDDTTFDGTFAAASGRLGGTLIKNSSGTLTLTNDNSYLGQMIVAGGGVFLDYSSGSTLTGGSSGGSAVSTSIAVHDDAWFGGYGDVLGDVTIHDGGTLAAGDSLINSAGTSYGDMTISGNLTISSGGVYAARIAPGGSAGDTVTVTGSATIDDAVFYYVANGDPLDYANASWDVITAGSGFDGTGFTSTDSNLAAFNPTITLNPATGKMVVTFDAKTLPTLSTANTLAVQRATQSLPAGSPLDLMVTSLATADYARAMEELSGEAHASLAGGLALMDRDFAGSLLSRSGKRAMESAILSAAAPSFASARGVASLHPRALDPRFANDFWVDAGYARNSVDSDGNAVRSVLKGPEFSLGYEHAAASGWLGGLAFRYADQTMEVDGRRSEADIDSYSLALYGGFRTAFGRGIARLTAGGAFARHTIDSTRRVAALGNQRLVADYNANSYQLFMEGAYALPVGVLWLEPFIDLTWTSLHVPGFMERGGAAALRSRSRTQGNASQLLGLRLALPVFCGVRLEAQAGWRHTYGNLNAEQTFAFVQGGNRFAVRGATQNRDEAVLDLRAAYQIRDNLRVGAEANAAVGKRGTNIRGGAFIALDW